MHPLLLASLILGIVGFGGLVILMLIIYRAYQRSGPGDTNHG